MKKKFYAVLAVSAMVFMLCSSCQKDNVQPSQSAKQRGTNSTSVSSESGAASSPSSSSYDASHPPTCPNHGG